MISGPFKYVTYKLFVYKSNIYYIYEQDLALNNLEGVICHKTQPTNYYDWVLFLMSYSYFWPCIYVS